MCVCLLHGSQKNLLSMCKTVVFVRISVVLKFHNLSFLSFIFSETASMCFVHKYLLWALCVYTCMHSAVIKLSSGKSAVPDSSK